MTLRCKGEVSGLGIVDEQDPSKVIDFFVVEQICSSTSTEMDQTAVANLIADMRDKGISPSRWRVWWHSHAAMKAFFSGTDEDNVERYASEKALWSVVTNHEDAKRVEAGQSPTEMYIRVDLFDPDNPKNISSPMRYTIEGCDWRVAPLSLVPDEWFEESMKKVGSQPVIKLDIKPEDKSKGTPVRVVYGSGGGHPYGSFRSGYGGAPWGAWRDEDEYSWWEGSKDDEKKADTVSIKNERPNDNLELITHFAIQEFLDMDLIEIDDAHILSHEYSTGEASDVKIHNILVDKWNRYLADQRALPPFKKTADHQETLNRLYRKVSDVLDMFELNKEAEPEKKAEQKAAQ